MNIIISESFDIRQHMAMKSIIALARDIRGNKFADEVVSADIYAINAFILAVVVAAMQILDTYQFMIFRAYYGIGVKEIDTPSIVNKFHIDEYEVGKIIDDAVSEISKMCQ